MMMPPPSPPSSLLHRRSALALAAGALAVALGGCHSLTRPPLSSASPRPIRAIAFDALAVFDAGSVVARCERAFPGQGEQLAASWRLRQFEYTWIRAVSRRPYIDFWHITQDALVYAAKSMSLDLSLSTRSELMDEWLSLRPWPDSVPALRALKSAGLRLAVLSNFTAAMQRECVHGSDLDGLFDDLPPLGDEVEPAPRRRRRLAPVAVAIGLFVLVASAVASSFTVMRVPWILLVVVGLLVWHRMGHHHSGHRSHSGSDH